MERTARKKIVFGIAGVVAWLVTQCVAVALAGAGHGWYAPLLASLSLIVLYPVVFIRAFASSSAPFGMTACILVAAIVFDLWLTASVLGYENTFYIGDERDDFLRVWHFGPGVTVLWIALWAGWQFLAIAPLLSRRAISD